MALKKKNKVAEVPAKRGRPANPDSAKAKTGKPVVIFLPPKLHAQVRLASIALGQNISITVRGLLSKWVVDNKKKIQQLVSSELGATDTDDEENEDVEVDEDEDTDTDEEESDEDEEEEEEDEDEE